MPAYIIIELTEIVDPENLKQYQNLAPGTIADHGGKFLIRGNSPFILEGDWDSERLVVLEFESLDAAKVWYHSDAYQSASEFRRLATNGRILLFEGFQGA